MQSEQQRTVDLTTTKQNEIVVRRLSNWLPSDTSVFDFSLRLPVCLSLCLYLSASITRPSRSGWFRKPNCILPAPPVYKRLTTASARQTEKRFAPDFLICPLQNPRSATADGIGTFLHRQILVATISIQRMDQHVDFIVNHCFTFFHHLLTQFNLSADQIYSLLSRLSRH